MNQLKLILARLTFLTRVVAEAISARRTFSNTCIVVAEAILAGLYHITLYVLAICVLCYIISYHSILHYIILLLIFLFEPLTLTLIITLFFLSGGDGAAPLVLVTVLPVCIARFASRRAQPLESLTA